MPTCVAASPTPGAAYMVSNMSSTSFLSSASNLVTGSAGVVSTGSGQVTIFNRAILYFWDSLSKCVCEQMRFYDEGWGFASCGTNPQITQITQIKKTGEGAKCNSDRFFKICVICEICGQFFNILLTALDSLRSSASSLPSYPRQISRAGLRLR